MFEPDVLAAIREIQQPRSRFQFEHFVLGQHDTEEMRYYQCCLELQDMIYKYQNAELELRKAEVEIRRLRASGDEIDGLDADIKQLGADQTRIVMVGAAREIAVLLDLWDSFPVKFTREQIELAQPDYWRSRLTRQVELQAIGGGHVDWAQLDALRQSNLLDTVLGEFESKATAPAVTARANILRQDSMSALPQPEKGTADA